MGIDPRTQKLAKLVVHYSLDIKNNEDVIISGSTEASDFITALYKEIILIGAHPILRITLPNLRPIFYKYAKDHQVKHFPKEYDCQVKNAQKYIGISTDLNTRELSNIDPEKITQRSKTIRPITNYIVNERDKIWRCTVGYPCSALAQDAQMSLDDYEDFVFRACLQDWDKLGKKIDQVLKRFKKGKSIHLIGSGVDLRFDIHGKLAQADKGEENMPGGEIFMAPVRESAEGWIKFDYPAIRNGNEVSGIYLEFHKGKVIKSRAQKNKRFLDAMLKVDENASYLGELGIGMNPKINKFTKDLLFDEKIGGTIHLALGNAYKQNGGGNDSAIHWDIVKNMKKAKIIMDDKVICENGVWKI
jgi:aminopeptidase